MLQGHRMKKTLLLLPALLLLASCQTREEWFREVCARWHSEKTSSEEWHLKLELTENDNIVEFCKFYD